MLHYEEATLNRSLDKSGHEMKVIDLIKESEKTDRVWVRLMSGEIREVFPKKVEADLLGHCLYLYTADAVYKITGKTSKKVLRFRDAHFELCENVSPGFGSISEYPPEKDRICVFLKRDIWKVFAAFEDPDTCIHLVFQAQDLGKIRAIKSRLDGKYDVTTTDELRFVVKLQ